MNPNKLVSVIIPTYKRSVFLPRAVNSVLEQTYKNIEIIIVDDNNPETNFRKDTENIMLQYQNNPMIKYIKHERNKNGSAARNTGFRNSNGDYIMFLDDDDEFTDNKIMAQIEKMEKLDETWGASYTNYIRKKNGKTTVYGAEKREGSLLREELMRNLFVHAGSNLMVRRKIVEEINGFDESFERNQDIEFLSRILVNYKLAFVDNIGLIIHVDNRNVAKTRSYEDITSDYITKFSGLINQLPEQDKIIVMKMIGLQTFRNYIFSKNKRRKAIIKLIKGETSALLATRYLIHLLVRRITKKAYGFNI